MIPTPIAALMRDVVTLEVMTDKDAYNAKVFAAPVSMICRVEQGDTRTWTKGGDDGDITFTVYTSDDVPGFTAEGRITLPDGSRPAIRSVQRHSWPDGSQHLVVSL